MLRLQRLLHSHLWKGKKKNSLFTVLRKPGARLEKKEGQVTIKNEALLMLVLIGSSRVTTLCDWSKKKNPPPFQPIRCKARVDRDGVDRDVVTRFFPPFFL